MRLHFVQSKSTCRSGCLWQSKFSYPTENFADFLSETEREKSGCSPRSPTEFRNGLPLFPCRELSEPITIELVKRLSEDVDAEVFCTYRIAERYVQLSLLHPMHL